MEHKIVNNYYYIFDENGIVIFSIELTDLPGNQVIIKTDTAVYSGPLPLLKIE